MTKNIDQAIDEVKPIMADDTGEPGYQEMKSALAVISRFDTHESKVMLTPASHARYILDSEVANGIIGSWDTGDLDDKTSQVETTFANLVVGRWNDTAVQNPAGVPGSGWMCLHENGEWRGEELANRNHVAFIQVPKDTVLHSRFRYACVRILSQTKGHDGRKVTLKMNGEWLDTMYTDKQLVEGILFGYSDHRSMEADQQALSQALRQLRSEHQARLNAVKDPDELERERMDRDEARLEALASKPRQRSSL